MKKYISDISYTYKGRLARDFGGVFDYFWRNVDLVVANPIELCDIKKARNVEQIKGTRFNPRRPVKGLSKTHSEWIYTYS